MPITRLAEPDAAEGTNYDNLPPMAAIRQATRADLIEWKPLFGASQPIGGTMRYDGVCAGELGLTLSTFGPGPDRLRAVAVTVQFPDREPVTLSSDPALIKGRHLHGLADGYPDLVGHIEAIVAHDPRNENQPAAAAFRDRLRQIAEEATQ